MASSPLLSHIYTISTVFFTLLLLELLISFRTLFKFLSIRSTPTPTNLFQLIEDKLPSSLYSRKIQTLTEPECCSVCLSRFEQGDKIRMLKCNHTFHQDCLDRWLEQDFATTCPLCRQEVLPKETVRMIRLSLVENQNQYDGSDEELIFLLSALQGSNLNTFL